MKRGVVLRWRAEVRFGKRKRVLQKPARSSLAAMCWLFEVAEGLGLPPAQLARHPDGGVVALGPGLEGWQGYVWPEARAERRVKA